jgi:sulfate adenylyltransferase subunit 1 (EFTu-like GTPase family)
VTCRVEQIHRTLDAAELTHALNRTRVDRHEIAECTLVLNTPLAFDTIDGSVATARFVIVDAHQISGGGVVVEALPDIERSTKIEQAVVWLTGLSGAGKTTIARELCARLNANGARSSISTATSSARLSPRVLAATNETPTFDAWDSWRAGSNTMASSPSAR